MKHLRVFHAGLVALSLCACQSPKSTESAPPFINACYALTASEMNRVQEAAEQGDAEACERLALHYSMVELDDSTAIIWLKEAVRLKPQDARLRRNLRMLLDPEGTEED